MLALLNLDEDHIGDFGPMNEHCSVQWILSNPSIGAAEFSALKKAGMGTGARAVARWLAGPKGIPSAAQPDFGSVEVRYYWNRYQVGGCNTTNDLSLAVVLQFGSFKTMFAGDLEANGWRGMMFNAAFRQDLIGLNIFVASHHGRDNGCCDELFDLFRPEIVIISDDEKQHGTQETDAWYRQRCLGAPLVSNPFDRRYVMTTRTDGSMRINAEANGRWRLDPFRADDWPRPKPKPSALELLGLLDNPLDPKPELNGLLSALASQTKAPATSALELFRLANQPTQANELNSLLRALGSK